MGCDNYRQADARWASYGYAGENMAAAGCGPTSVANIVHQLPTRVADYLTSIGGAVNGCGTNWHSIETALSHYGYSGQQLNGSSMYGTSGSSAENKWKSAMATGKYYGILLMGKGVFTSGGHYITITQYSNGRCYVHDPASAARDGWHAWSDFNKCVKIFYLAANKDYKATTSTTPSSGNASAYVYSFKPDTVQNGSSGLSTLLLQEILAARGYDTGGLDRSAGKKTATAIKKYQASRKVLTADGICGAATWCDLLALPKTNGAYGLESIKEGSTGTAVLLLQEILTARRYYSLALDRKFESGTKAALKKYQTDRKGGAGEVDGIAGAKVWKDLIAL